MKSCHCRNIFTIFKGNVHLPYLRPKGNGHRFKRIDDSFINFLEILLLSHISSLIETPCIYVL